MLNLLILQIRSYLVLDDIFWLFLWSWALLIIMRITSIILLYCWIIVIMNLLLLDLLRWLYYRSRWSVESWSSHGWSKHRRLTHPTRHHSRSHASGARGSETWYSILSSWHHSRCKVCVLLLWRLLQLLLILLSLWNTFSLNIIISN